MTLSIASAAPIDENDGERDLADDEKPLRQSAPVGGAASATEDLARIDADQTKRRQHAERETDEHRYRQREHQRAPIDRERHPRGRVRGDRARDVSRAEQRHDDAKRAAGDGDDDVLREKLAEQSSTRCADRGANGDLSGTHRRACDL